MISRINRRDFIRTTAVAAGAAAGLGGNFLAGADDLEAVKKTRSYNPDMEYRRLGGTGLWVSAVCLGGHWKRVAEKLNMKINAYDFPKDKTANEALRKNRHDVLSRCIEVGINYVDACTTGEISVYGPALKGRREKMYMGFAMWPECPRKKEYRTADILLKTLEDGLKLAEVEYVDVWRLVAETNGKHSPADEEEFIKAFEKARQQGKVRFTGVSSHGRDWLKRLAETYPKHFQVMLFPYTADSKELPQDSLFEAVRKHDIGTFGIKPFGSNSLFAGAADDEERSRRARQAVRYILGNPAITAPIPGLACVEEVDNMAKAVKENRLARAEEQEFRLVARDMWANLSPEYAWLRNWEYV